MGGSLVSGEIEGSIGSLRWGRPGVIGLLGWTSRYKGEWRFAERTTFMEYLCNERS